MNIIKIVYTYRKYSIDKNLHTGKGDNLKRAKARVVNMHHMPYPCGYDSFHTFLSIYLFYLFDQTIKGPKLQKAEAEEKVKPSNNNNNFR